MMVVYATTEDLADFLVTIPVWPGAERHLRQASEDIDDLLIGAVYDVDTNQMPTDPRIREAVKRATCAQAHFIQTGGDETGAKSGFSSVSVGGVSYSRSSQVTIGSGRASQEFSPRTLRILHVEGLLPVRPRTRSGGSGAP
ncbi:hypothetical protein [Actinomadura violacea]|uniref:Uncharacterized protein n=1 Tax=Actinomadura violacea TaxID=2819934 RepID=A0ABS3RSR7_9ACTN|nr:hypothetical protein [Actinomadura violacea]MBO2459811.1 hypothetical protein [Actinomadura violacea]